MKEGVRYVIMVISINPERSELNELSLMNKNIEVLEFSYDNDTHIVTNIVHEI